MVELAPPGGYSKRSECVAECRQDDCHEDALKAEENHFSERECLSDG